MSRQVYILFLAATFAVIVRGGSKGGGSKSGGSKSGGGSSHGSYPTQKWAPAPAQPSYPSGSSSKGNGNRPGSYPTQKWAPATAQPSYPSYNPSGSSSKGNGNRPGSYPTQKWAPATAQPSYPSYNPSGSNFQGGSSGYPSYNPSGISSGSYPNYNPSGSISQGNVPGYPNHNPNRNPSYPGYSSQSSSGFPQPAYNPNYPVPPAPIKPPKHNGIGTAIAAGAAGGVVGAAIATQIKRPKVKIYMHVGGHRYDSSSSEEYFRPYVTGPNGRYMYPPKRAGYKLTEEGERIYRMTSVMNSLCGKLSQPLACSMLKVQGVRPFTHPNSMFKTPSEQPRNASLVTVESLTRESSKSAVTPVQNDTEKVTPTTSWSTSSVLPSATVEIITEVLNVKNDTEEVTTSTSGTTSSVLPSATVEITTEVFNFTTTP